MRRSTQEEPFQSAVMHRPASLVRPAFKIAVIGFNNSSCASLDLTLRCHSSALMLGRPVEEVGQEQPIVQKEMGGPDGNWLSKRARQNEAAAGSSAIASPVQLQKFDGLTGTWLQIGPRMRKARE